MFKDLTNFKTKRTALQALGFYIAYLVLVVILAMLSAIVIATPLGKQDNFQFGAQIGQAVAVITCLALSFMILKSKKQTNNFMFIILTLLSGVLAYFGGGLLGLIPVAYLTTK